MKSYACMFMYARARARARIFLLDLVMLDAHDELGKPRFSAHLQQYTCMNELAEFGCAHCQVGHYYIALS